MDKYIHSQNITNLINNYITLAHKYFKERIYSIYLIGSLAHGGFSLRTSDIDLCVILSDIPKPPTDGLRMEQIKANLVSTQLSYAEKISIFWEYCHSLSKKKALGRMPLLDKEDLRLHGILLEGKEARSAIYTPSKSDLIEESAYFIIDYLCTDARVSILNNPLLLLKESATLISKVILFPVRLLYTFYTGNIGYNHLSVDYYKDQLKGENRVLVENAYLIRNQGYVSPLLSAHISKIKHLYTELISTFKLYFDRYSANKFLSVELLKVLNKL